MVDPILSRLKFQHREILIIIPVYLGNTKQYKAIQGGNNEETRRVQNMADLCSGAPVVFDAVGQGAAIVNHIHYAAGDRLGITIALIISTKPS